MKWAVVKIVDAGAGRIVGCMVGPFDLKHTAEEYAERAGRSCLGYENWVVRELQKPSRL
jgi:hypothetical protein